MKIFIVFFLIIQLTSVFGQSFAPPSNEVGTLAMHKDSSAFVGWATSCSVDRGYQDINNTSLGLASAGLDEYGTGAPFNNGVVSLGDNGIAILTFDEPIADGEGPDFAVFENSFSNDFLELAFVEVSSDGITYVRFDAVSLTQVDTQVEPEGTTNAEDYYNLAGKYRAGYGTPFDLNELAGNPDINIDSINYIKIIDVIGSIDPAYATYDSEGNMINDPWPTNYPTGGFDLDAVGVINVYTEVGIDDINTGKVMVFPNPVSNILQFKSNVEYHSYQIFDIDGREKLSKQETQNSTANINVTQFTEGVYFLHVNTDSGVIRTTFIKIN
ncbi:MAG: T9SS type A sorting domain-containing protein [Flavobacteriales bacterium]|nr:T9SS type A sorting domain-containing protein [Flavobacteriales bacterium]